MKTNEKVFLNIEKVNPLLNGYKKKFIYERLGLSRAEGTLLLRHGCLPEEEDIKSSVLIGLSELTALSREELLVTFSKTVA